MSAELHSEIIFCSVDHLSDLEQGLSKEGGLAFFVCLELCDWKKCATARPND